MCFGWDDADNFAWHMLALAALRYAHAQMWNTLSRLHAVSAKHRIYGKGVDFKQIDREANWDDFIILQTVVITLVHNLPGLNFNGWPLMNWVSTCSALKPPSARCKRSDATSQLRP